MATMPAAVVPEAKKLSFAKIVAASSSKNSASITIARTPAPSAAKDKREMTPQVPTVPVAVPRVVPARPSAKAGDAPREAQTAAASGQTSATEELSGLKEFKSQTMMSNLVVNGSSNITDGSANASSSHTPSDDNSQRADSSSDLGTKPPSVDGKSITSGTTFALDEKESLRPDDSASVKAAADDDDGFSVRGSNIATSRMGSEVAARFRRGEVQIQWGDLPIRSITNVQSMPGPHAPGIATPQSADSEKPPIVDSKVPLSSGPAGPDALFLSQNPDEKLLDAMQTPKDRLFLLRLEQQVIEFVQDSKEPFMDLPPSNSFCRMLMHKLADYYHMTHSFEAGAGAVQIFRTPFCRIPPSLSSISVTTSTSSSPAPAVLPRKIMRRGEIGEFGPGSAAPSKPTSEDGSDSKDKDAVPKEKLTREEREERYNKARQRIFGAADKAEGAATEGDDANGVSRASSVSAKDRSNVGKRKPNKQRRGDIDEGFDPRSKYVVLNYGAQQTAAWAPAQAQYYASYTAPYEAQYQQPYPAGIPPTYAPTQQFQPYGPQYPAMAGYPAASAPQAVPPQAQRFQPPGPSMPGSYATPGPSSLGQVPPVMPPAPNGMPQPAWQPLPQPMQQPIPQALPQPLQQPMQQPMPQPMQQAPFNQNPYPPTRGSPNPGGIPYAFGQLPANANPNDPKSQHPIPGSYTRPPFNPKSQAFVPSNGMGQMPGSNPYGASSPHHGSPQFNSPRISYSGFQQPLPQPVYPGPGAYGMARQGSNNSMTHFHPVQPPMGPPHGPQHLPPHPNSPHIPNKSVGPPGSVQTFNHLPNYGNPATLPQKPI